MGVSKANIRTDHGVVCRAVQHMLREQAAREALTEAELRGLDVKVQAHFDISSMALRLQIMWHDPIDPKRTRTLDQLIDDREVRDLGLLAMKVNDTVKNLSLRGELFFFRLAKYYPRHLNKVRCDGHGKVTVEFKNGHTLEAREDEIEHTEFLAKCGMVYDL